MARPYRYHLWDDSEFDGKPAFGSIIKRVPNVLIEGKVNPDGQLKEFYSLVRDFSELRKEGASKGIVDEGVTEVGTSFEGRAIPALKVGKGARHKVIFTGAHHSREWVSVEIPYYVAEYLIRNYREEPATYKERLVKRLVDTRTIWFIPMVNPDGHMYTSSKDRMWRANRRKVSYAGLTITRHWTRAGRLSRTLEPGGRTETFEVPAGNAIGVDINRNYPTQEWGIETGKGGYVKTSRDPGQGGQNSIWCGPSAGSEPETKAISDLMRREQFRASITYHNYSQLFLYPDAAKEDDFVLDVGKGMHSLINETASPPYKFQAGSALYETTGDSMDFSYEASPGRPSYTPELRPPDDAPDPIKFSGLPEDQLEPCFKENLGAALALINCAGRNRAPSNSTNTVISGNLVDVAVRMNCWEVFKGWQP